MEKKYAQIILPLRLEWIPFYQTGGEDLEVGDKVSVIFARKRYVGVVYSLSDTLPRELDGKKVIGISAVERSLERIDPLDIKFWESLAEYYMCTIGEVYRTAYPAMKIAGEEVQARKKERLAERIAARRAEISRIQELIDSTGGEKLNAKRRLRIEAIETEIESLAAGGGRPQGAALPAAPELTAAQQKAAEAVRAAFRERKPALLKGVTGSGKTEIYIKLALEALERGENVLYLVPEIALSRQLEERLGKYFSDLLMVFHSHETPARRSEVASRTAGGEPYVVLGTRSALFLPHRHLGLIVVDEEHDSSYKQDGAPRYNGRDAAVMMAFQRGCPVVMGSATPSLESLYNVQSGRYAMATLESSYHGAEAAEVEVIDTIAERRKRGMRGSFSIKLIQQIRSTLDKGEQVMILRERRSYSPVLQCEACGAIPKCPRCNIPLSLHTAGGRLVCHRCGFHLPGGTECPECGGELKGIGAGTQKIEEEVRELFPQARVARLDSDSAQDRKFEAQTIRDFAAGRIDILVGTQIISKGFDFEGLSLVAVIAADGMLAQQDFRADEKAIQQLEQLRGRCGRRESRGLFVVQTARADHPVYSQFSGVEISSRLMDERHDFHYPPYCRLIRLSLEDEDGIRREKMATSLSSALYIALERSGGTSGDAAVTGPFQGAIEVTLPKDRSLASRKKALRDAVADFEKRMKYTGHITIDVDPA